jgi:hypothetical protein
MHQPPKKGSYKRYRLATGLSSSKTGRDTVCDKVIKQAKNYIKRHESKGDTTSGYSRNINDTRCDERAVKCEIEQAKYLLSLLLVFWILGIFGLLGLLWCLGFAVVVTMMVVVKMVGE